MELGPCDPWRRQLLSYGSSCACAEKRNTRTTCWAQLYRYPMLSAQFTLYERPMQAYGQSPWSGGSALATTQGCKNMLRRITYPSVQRLGASSKGSREVLPCGCKQQQDA